MASTYNGEVSGVNLRTTHQTIFSRPRISTDVEWMCFNRVGWAQAIGIESFGGEAMTDPAIFVQTKPGGMLEYDDGVYATGNPINAATTAPHHTGRMDPRQPGLTEGGDECLWAWHALERWAYIPTRDIHDNAKGIVKLKTMRTMEMMKSFAEGFNQAILGNSSGPDYGVKGPSATYCDMSNLISVTQTRTVGGYATTNSEWQNGTTEVASIGGGGEYNSPERLRELMDATRIDRMRYAECSGKFVYLATPGAYLYLKRLMRADVNRSGNSAVWGSNSKYDAAGIDNIQFAGGPVIFDMNAAIPYGATASTEAIYMIDTAHYKVSIRREENFKFHDWEEPRNHDQYNAHVAGLTLRYTPKLTSRRSHAVMYNIPDNSDIS